MGGRDQERERGGKSEREERERERVKKRGREREERESEREGRKELDEREKGQERFLKSSTTDFSPQSNPLLYFPNLLH